MQLEARLLRALGDCDVARAIDGEHSACEPWTLSSVSRAVAQSREYQKRGRDGEANRLLSRALHSAAKQGTPVTAIPPWLTEARDVHFVAPDRFVVQHAEGISIIDGEDLVERRRCEGLQSLHEVSPHGSYAVLWGRTPSLVRLATCERFEWGARRVAFSADERVVAFYDGTSLHVWGLPERRPLWTLSLRDKGDPERPGTLCLSPAGSFLAVVPRYGLPTLLDARTSQAGPALAGDLEKEPTLTFADWPGELPNREASSCEFSPDGSVLAVATARCAEVPDTTRIWKTRTGRLLAKVPGLMYDLSADLSRSVQYPRTWRPGVARGTPRLLDWRRNEAADFQGGQDGTFSHNRRLWALRAAAQACIGTVDAPRPVKCLPVPEQARLVLGADGQAVGIRDANRLTVYRLPEWTSTSRLVPESDSLRLHGAGRWSTLASMTGEKARICRTDKPLRLATTLSAAPPFVAFHNGELCIDDTCVYPGGVSRATPHYTERDLLHPSAQVYADAFEARTFDKRQVVKWRWPAEERPNTRYDVTEGFFNDWGTEAWLRMGAHVYLFSAHDGSVRRRFSPSERCDPRGGRAFMQLARSAGLLLVHAGDGAGCTSLIHLGTRRTTTLDLSKAWLAALSGDGKSVATYADGTVSVHAIEPWRTVARFSLPGGSPARLALSHDGSFLVAQYDAHFEGSDESFRVVPGELRFMHRDGTATAQGALVLGDPHPVDLESPAVEFSDRVFGYAGKLFDFSGRQVAAFEHMGRQILARFPDGTVEVFGERLDPPYRCLVNGEVFGGTVCRDHVEVSGRLHRLVAGEGPPPPGWARQGTRPWNGPPLPPHCREPVQICGQELSLREHSVHCPPSYSVDAEALACLIPDDLALAGSRFEAFSPRQSLAELLRLDASDTSLRDLQPIARAHRLARLVLAGTAVTDLTPLAALSELAYLDLSRTPVTDLTPLQGLSELGELILDESKVTSLTGLQRLPSLRSLSMKHTKVTDLGPLAHSKSLRTLRLEGAPIQDLAPVERIPGLTWTR